MNKGTVKFFNNSKGFGFIKDEESDKEYFVHVTGLIDEVKENDEVTFDLTEGRKGLNAVNVKLAQFNIFITLKKINVSTIEPTFVVKLRKNNENQNVSAMLL